MKRIAVLLLFLAFTVASFGQFQGFFQPVKENPYFKGAKNTVDRASSLWLIRASGQVNALAFYYDKEAKQVKTIPFGKVGFGIGYVRYKDVDGVPETNLSINALVLTDIDQPDATKITLGATVKTFNLVEVGLAYDFGLKRPMLLTGLSYTF